MSYSVSSQLQVLKEIELQCGLRSRSPVSLSVPGMPAEEISFYCGLLAELGMIKVSTLRGKDFDAHFPVHLTHEGTRFLGEANKTFWESAEKVALDMAGHWVGLDIANAASFFRSVIQKFKRDIPNV